MVLTLLLCSKTLTSFPSTNLLKLSRLQTLGVGKCNNACFTGQAVIFLSNEPGTDQNEGSLCCSCRYLSAQLQVEVTWVKCSWWSNPTQETWEETGKLFLDLCWGSIPEVKGCMLISQTFDYRMSFPILLYSWCSLPRRTVLNICFSLFYRRISSLFLVFKHINQTHAFKWLLDALFQVLCKICRSGIK